MSLVNQDDVITFADSPWGYIVSVPPGNILASAAGDMGQVAGDIVQIAKKLLGEFGIQTPDTLIYKEHLSYREYLKALPPPPPGVQNDVHNEVRVNGGTVVGLFYLPSLPDDKLAGLRDFGSKFTPKLPVVLLVPTYTPPPPPLYQEWQKEIRDATPPPAP